MVKTLPYDVLLNIFKYLTIADIYSVSRINSFWSEVAKDIIKSRGPICITIVRKKEFSVVTWNNINKVMLDNLSIKVKLLMRFCENNDIVRFNDECPCKDLPISCLSIFIGNECYIKPNHNNYVNLFLPDTPSLQFNSRSFFIDSRFNELYCPECASHIDTFLNIIDCWKPNYDNLFIQDSTTKNCMIFLCEFNSLDLAKKLAENFVKWYPDNSIHVWGGIVDLLKICTFDLDKHICSRNSKCVTIFIKSNDMNTWSVTIDKDCNNEKQLENIFTDFKKIVTLKKHSICFIYTPANRLEFYNLEITIFKKIFPKMLVFHIFGFASFGENLQDLLKLLLATKKVAFRSQRRKKFTSSKTKLMILTYN